MDPWFSSLAADYPMVTPHMLLDIQHRKLNVKDIPKFTASFSSDPSEAPEVKGMLQLMRPFDAFCQIVGELAPAPVQMRLMRAMSLYRGKLVVMASSYTFTSILAWHNEILARKIRIGLDDPDIWRGGHKEVDFMLQASQRQQQPQRPTAAPRATDSYTPSYGQPSTRRPRALPRKDPNDPYTVRNGGCAEYNNGSCTVKDCRFIHVCVFCQERDHGAVNCPKRRR